MWTKYVSSALMSILLVTSLIALPSFIVTITSQTVSANPSPDNYSFTIIALPDTQYYSMALPQGYPWVFENQTEWIIQNENENNIVFVTHLGDIVEHYSYNAEWVNANIAMSILDNKVPYTVLPGNHDEDGGYQNPGPGASYYEGYFPASRYQGYYYWGGSYDPAAVTSPSPNMNNYQLFTWAGMNFITLSIQYNPPADVLSWADNILSKYSDRRAIISTHSYLNTNGSLTSDGGRQIHDSVVVPENNVFLVLCGHEVNSDNLGEAQKIDNLGNRTVYQLLSDYQDYMGNGGDGWLRIMKFVPSENKIYVQTYSPYLDNYMIGPSSQFELSYPMAGAGSVSVLISPSSQVRVHGSTFEYAVNVMNTGINDDNYILSVTDDENWNPTLSDSSLLIQAGKNSGTTLMLTIPENAAYGDVDNITVTATSQTDNAVSGSGSCTARSATVSCKLSINPGYLANLPGENITFTVWVKNTSDDPVFRDNYTLIASDDAGWPLSIGNIENALTGENKEATLTVTIPVDAVINTKDNILVTVISSENSDVRDNSQCVASAAVYSGTASIRMAGTGSTSPPFLYGIYKVTLTGSLLISADNLHLIFLKYDNKTIEADNVIWSRTAPGAETVTFTNLIIQHDNHTPPSQTSYAKRIKLVLTDSTGAVVLDNMAWYTVVQDDWSNRISWVILKWGSHNSSQQDQLSNEISAIILNWGSVPTTRDQHDFPQ
jgi:hypothetical protein